MVSPQGTGDANYTLVCRFTVTRPLQSNTAIISSWIQLLLGNMTLLVPDYFEATQKHCKNVLGY